LNESERRRIWYNNEELSKFRKNAQEDAASVNLKCPVREHTNDLSFLKSLKRTHQGFPAMVFSDMVVFEEYTQRLEITRGLEIRINPERLKNRYISRLAVLEIQRRLKKKSSKSAIEAQANIAKIAMRFSGWAREIALRVGQIDEAVVNSCNELIRISLRDERNHTDGGDPLKKARNTTIIVET